MPRSHVDSVNSAVPMFFLYGEPRQTVSPRFLHLETLEARSRPGDWTIRPHTHADLHHLFLIVTGAGNMQADGQVLPFAAPCLLTMPLGIVHGFSWEPETQGHVLTLSEGYLKDLRARAPSLGALSPLRSHFRAPTWRGSVPPWPRSGANSPGPLRGTRRPWTPIC